MRLTRLGLAVLIIVSILLLKGSSPLVQMAAAKTQAGSQGQVAESMSTRDAPPDTTPYWRPAVPEDYAPKSTRPIPLIPNILIVDTVVNNTDPNLTNTDTFNDGETS